MGGSYPDAPSRRMAWDADGSVALWRRIAANGLLPSQWSELGTPTKENINDENPATGQDTNPGGGTASQFHFVVIFPELREFDGFFWQSLIANSTPSPSNLQTSPDTNNGINGTWTTRDGSFTHGGTDLDSYRSVTSFAIPTIRAVRYHWQTQDNQGWRHIRSAHIYGEISPGETPDRLLFIDEATGLEYTSPVDFGDIPRGSSEDFEFRLKNNSASLTIETIQYTASSLYESSGSWYTFTLPGGSTYQATRQVASLAPATTTGVITGRRITPASEALQVHAGRISATHASLS